MAFLGLHSMHRPLLFYITSEPVRWRGGCDEWVDAVTSATGIVC